MGYGELRRVTWSHVALHGLLRVTEGYMGYGELKRVT